MTISALIGGTAGNAIATTSSFTVGTNKFSTDTLQNGSDCLATDAADALVDAITNNDTQGVSATDSGGGDVTLAAKVSGADGNGITLATTMANGTFDGGATALSGGKDGTIGLEGEQRFDSDWLYICTADNTTAGTNWRRIDIGSAY
jgi:phage tail sheath gpL-like